MLKTDFKTILGCFLAALVGPACKLMTMIPQVIYNVLSGLFFVIAINACLYACRVKDGKSRKERFRWALCSIVLSLGLFVCTIIYPSISTDEHHATIEFESRIDELDTLRVMADNGDVDAMLALGALRAQPYTSGSLVEDWSMVDYAEAEKYLEEAAAEGSSDAYAILASMKYNGYGHVKSRQRAIDDVIKGYKIDSCSASIYHEIVGIGITEEEFPESVKVLERERKKQELLESKRNILSSILSDFADLYSTGDTEKIRTYCITMLPVAESLGIDPEPDEEGTLAWMCLFANDYEKGFEYAKDLLEDENPSGITRLFYTERQVYDKYQKNIDYVLAHTEDGTIRSLTDKYAQLLGLDQYYCLALRLEQLKREPLGEDSIKLQDTSDFKSLKNAYTSLRQAFIDSPAKKGTLEPAPYLRVRIDDNPAGGFRAWFDFYSSSDEDRGN